jgi:hypothetical protein
MSDKFSTNSIIDFTFFILACRVQDNFCFFLGCDWLPQEFGLRSSKRYFSSLFLVFIKFRRNVVRLPASVYLAFIVVLYIEMYGFPLTMYAITWLFGFSNAGNLWELFMGLIRRDLFVVIFLGFILPISNMIILIGILLIVFGWRMIFRSKGQACNNGHLWARSSSTISGIYITHFRYECSLDHDIYGFVMAHTSPPVLSTCQRRR